VLQKVNEIDENIAPHWELLMKKVNACSENISVDEFLTNNFHAKKYEGLRSQFKKYVQGYDAADTKYASILAIKKEMKHEDESQYRPVPGYDALIGYLAKICLELNSVIKTHEAAIKIINHKNNIEVITSLGKYNAEKLIVAVPLGVLQSAKISKSFINLPACLSLYTKMAKQIGNGSVIKILLQFDKAFWLDKDFLETRNIEPPLYIFTDEKIPTWWTQYPSKVPLLTGWIGGPPAYKMKNYSERRFKTLVMESLASIFSLPKFEIEKRLINYKIMNWSKEPHILGGYSYTTLKTEKARKFMNQPYENTFYFAGEYLPENSSSTVEAALRSGRAAATKILSKDNAF